MLGRNLAVSSHVTVRSGCPLRITVDTGDQATIVWGLSSPDEFEIALERDVLTELVELGAEALRTMAAEDA